MRFPHVCLTVSASLLLAVFSVSCGVNGAPPPPRKPQQVLYRWYDDGGSGKVSVRISLKDQIADIERGGRDIGWCYVATGKEGHGTSPGTYKITEKIVDKYSNRYGWIEDELGNVVDGDAKPTDKVPEGMVYVPAPMPYWMRLTSYGIGMHGGLIPEPGKPASHGCIRLPKDFVHILFDSVDVGTTVVITNAPAKGGPSQVPAPSAAPEGGFTGNSRVVGSRPMTPEEEFRYSNRTRLLVDPYGAY